ncbi:flavodoxin-dependent (E)-4-hydroxy-3-methylbut-2-enyl-diphosphate synthase [Peptococcus simiae]|uniref:4-hydroxy-3-methylbut-2-en-1-yl diphosphate synthase (flavodoxin) n=1 Tax=Peptococcus simiae TaxID=1643805 RepID=A0ABW9H1B8_9FIRM
MLGMRHKTRSFYVRDLGFGGDHPIVVQSMTNTDTHDLAATLAQIRALDQAGAQLVRLAVPDKAAIPFLEKLLDQSPVPLVADIHFDYRLALAAIACGVDGVRINPGNIGGLDRFRQVIKACLEKDTPMRIGVNSGSVEKKLLEKYGGPTPEAMVESLCQHVRVCEEAGYGKLVLSVKASSVPEMVRANRLAAQELDYPLHLGVTEAGGVRMGTIKSAVGIGALLVDGIGDTLRVSLSGDPLNELPVAYDILKASGRLKQGVNIIACPTCGRTQIDLVPLLEAVEERTRHIQRPLNIAVMGCAVNGPGEAREADIGIAGGKGMGLIFRKGEIVARASEDQLLASFDQHLQQLLMEDSES